MPSDEQIRAGLDRLASSLPTAATNADLTIAQDRGTRRRRQRRAIRGALAAVFVVAAVGVAALARDVPGPQPLEVADGPPTTSTSSTAPATTWTAPADDPTQPSPAAIAADREFRIVPEGLLDCGTAITTAGYPTTTVAPPDWSGCIDAAAMNGTPAQYSVTARDFDGGMTGEIFRVNPDGSLENIGYQVDIDGEVSSRTHVCDEFRTSDSFGDIVCATTGIDVADIDVGAPTAAAVAADRVIREVPAGYDSCGSIVTTAGWPTTIPVGPEAAACILGTANEGIAAQFSVTGRDFEGGMVGTVIRVEEDGSISYIDYQVSPGGTVTETERPCSSFVLEPNSPVPGCLD